MKALRIGEMGVVRAYRTFLEDILHIWDVYQAWVFEIDGFFGRLNDQVGNKIDRIGEGNAED